MMGVAFVMSLAHAEDVEVEVVRGLREGEVDELLAVLVDVGRDPAPVAVADVVKVLEAALPRQPVRLKYVRFGKKCRVIHQVR